jgi:hypothetical protein
MVMIENSCSRDRKMEGITYKSGLGFLGFMGLVGK